MTSAFKKALKIFSWTVAVIALTLLGARIYNIQQGPPLAAWHTYVPDEYHAEQLDHTTWQDYIAHEAAFFTEVRQHVSAEIEPDDRVESNRYFEDAKVNPNRFSHDWNRSYILTPAGEPHG